MRRHGGRWPIRFLRSLQPGLAALGAFWGLHPPPQWVAEGKPHPPQQPSRSDHSSGPDHPERLVPHLPLSPAERALWSQLTFGALGDPEAGHVDRPH
ncbi:hypothetical protein OHT93_28615 [Streptomyces sp. NBC_00191]|uniref:DUF6059 family protein n=1 Tax=Streptomyces sp. NBC_00191 TaxID=2975674 RepID=UPI0032460F14